MPSISSHSFINISKCSRFSLHPSGLHRCSAAHNPHLMSPPTLQLSEAAVCPLETKSMTGQTRGDSFYIWVDVNSRSRPSLPICSPLIPVSSLNLCDAVWAEQTWNISAVCKHYLAVDFQTTSARALPEKRPHDWSHIAPVETRMQTRAPNDDFIQVRQPVGRPGWMESVYGGQTLRTLGKYWFKLRDDSTPSGLGVRLQQHEHHTVGILSSRDKCLLTSVHDTLLGSWFSSPSSSLYVQLLAIHILFWPECLLTLHSSRIPLILTLRPCSSIL